MNNELERRVSQWQQYPSAQWL